MHSPNLVHVPGPFPLVLGGSLPELTIAWEEWGTRRADNSNTIMVMPALSAHSHLHSSAANKAEGWWEGMVGPGKAFDTSRWHFICASLLGSCYGTTGPLSTDPRTGELYGRDFPQITPADMVHVHAALLDALGIRRLHGVVGASLGGMEVLQFAAEYPDRVGSFIALSMTARTTPHTVALRRIGRRAIRLDPKYADGRYTPGDGPVEGLKLAREIGTIVYRSRDEFNRRFRHEAVGPLTSIDRTFEVETYLQAHGERFAPRFDANAYLVLSRCMDLMNLGDGMPSLEDGIRRIKARGLIIGVNRDALIPADEQRLVATVLRDAGRDVIYEELDSIYGHDAFLKELAWLEPKFRAFFAHG